MTTRDPVKITDPKTIRALAHPARLTPSAMSYHLRSLERTGIVERAPSTGDGRERPWRAAGPSLHVETDSDFGDYAALEAIVLTRLGDQLAAWMARQQHEPREWRDAAIVGSAQVSLTADELGDLGRLIQQTVDEHRNRDAPRPDARNARRSTFAFPSGTSTRPRQ